MSKIGKSTEKVDEWLPGDGEGELDYVISLWVDENSLDLDQTIVTIAQYCEYIKNKFKKPSELYTFKMLKWSFLCCVNFISLKELVGER